MTSVEKCPPITDTDIEAIRVATDALDKISSRRKLRTGLHHILTRYYMNHRGGLPEPLRNDEGGIEVVTDMASLFTYLSTCERGLAHRMSKEVCAIPTVDAENQCKLCENPAHSKGLCQNHYQQQRRASKKAAERKP